MTDPADQTANYNTPLSAEDELSFSRWQSKLPPQLRSTSDYDLRGAYRTGAKAAANGHLPDTYKKPNHPTFSAESIYSGPASQGGNWVQGADGKWLFFATPDDLRYRDANALRDYFARAEPDSRLILPQNNALIGGAR